MTSHHDITWQRYITLWCHGIMSWFSYIICQDIMWMYTSRPILKSKNHFFSSWWLWPSTYDLDLQTHPRQCRGTSLHQILGLYVKSFRHDRADRHTDSGDLSPTRTCVPYVLLATVWGQLWHHQFFIRMKNTCEPKNNCNSVTHSNTCEPINQPCDPFKYM